MEQIEKMSKEILNNKIVQNSLLIAGTVTLSGIGYRVAQSIWRLVRPTKNFIKRYGEGSWVLVTGGTDGIGKAYCQEFAQCGFNIIIIGRNEEKSNIVADQLRLINPKIKVKYIIVDFKAGYDTNIYEKIMKNISNLDISILVNNVGIGIFKKIGEYNDEELIDQIVINCLPQTILTNRLFKQLKSRYKKSAIINISSLATTLCHAKTSCLTGTKAYNEFFSDTILQETNGKIDILSVQAGLVETAAFKKAGFPKTIWNITPTQCARGSLQSLGYESKTPGHYVHRLLSFILSINQHLFFSLDT